MAAEQEFPFDVPDDAPRDMQAIAKLHANVVALSVATDKLVHDHVNLSDDVAKLAKAHAALHQQVSKTARTRSDAPSSVRWDSLDRPTASAVWAWLINRVQWLVERYSLQEDLGQCWPQHPALVEELTALCLAWHHAYDGSARDAPLRWHEALDRARRRWREWDRQSKCRLGRHTDTPVAAAWSPQWRDAAFEIAQADVAGRPVPKRKPGRKQATK